MRGPFDGADESTCLQEHGQALLSSELLLCSAEANPVELEEETSPPLSGREERQDLVAMFLLSQLIPIFMVNEQRPRTWCATLETFTRSSHGMAISPLLWIPLGCRADRMGNEEDLPPLL